MRIFEWCFIYERDNVLTLLEQSSNKSHKDQKSKTQFLLPDVSTHISNRNENSSMNSSLLYNSTHNTPQGPTYNFSELIILINKLIELNYKPMIILHERHKIPTNLYFLKKYIIKTPRNTYDDNYLIYGMCKKGINIISNDLFRDHLNNMNIFTKCYVESMTFKYIDKNIFIPKYTKCIQIINNMCYIPTDQDFYCLPTIAASTNSQLIDLVRM